MDETVIEDKSEHVEAVTALSNDFLKLACEKGYKYNIIIFACVNLIRHIICKVANEKNHEQLKNAAIKLISAPFNKVE